MPEIGPVPDFARLSPMMSATRLWPLGLRLTGWIGSALVRTIRSSGFGGAFANRRLNFFFLV